MASSCDPLDYQYNNKYGFHRTPPTDSNGESQSITHDNISRPSRSSAQEQSLPPSGGQLAPILYNSDNISDSIRRTSGSMTDNIRSSTMSTQISGQAYRSENFQIRWYWIIPPVALPLFTIFLLIAMMLTSRDQPVLWKSSVFPLLTSQLQPVDEHNVARLRHPDQVESLSKKIKVRFGEEDGSLVFADQ